MLRYSFAVLFMDRPMFLLAFPEKKKMKHGLTTLVELLQKTVPLKNADDRIHYLNSCKRQDDDHYDVKL